MLRRRYGYGPFIKDKTFLDSASSAKISRDIFRSVDINVCYLKCTFEFHHFIYLIYNDMTGLEIVYIHTDV